MSADGNIKIISEVYEAFGRGDIAAVLDAVTDDVDWAAEAADSSGAPWYGVRHGRGEVAKFFEDFQCFRKQSPAPTIAKLFIDFVEESIKVGDHSHVHEDAMYNLFPPVLFVLCGKRAGVTKLPDKGGLNFLRIGNRAIAASDFSVDFSDRTASGKQGFCRVE